MVEYDPFSEEVMSGNQQPIYRQLRDEDPCYYLEKYDAWVLTRFEDVWNASLDQESFTHTQGTTSGQVLTKVQPVTPMINVMDPPEHTELRSQIRKFFMPGAVRRLEGTIQGLIEACFQEFYPRGECDVMGDFTSRVSVKTLCHLVGIPMEDADKLNDLVWRFFGREEGVDGMTEDGVAAMMELNAYGVELAKKRRSEPGRDDIVDLFLNVEIGGRKLVDEEIGSHLTMLIVGGSETFPRTFASITRRLWENPEARQECIEDPGLIPDAYQEGLRYDMPTQFLCRTVVKPVTFHGKTMKPGQGLCLVYPSANRDEREFPNPDVFDIHRKAPRILSFGQGLHLCLGMQVAKLEGRLCLETMLERMPDYVVDLDRSEWFRTDFVQGYSSLYITYTPR